MMQLFLNLNDRFSKLAEAVAVILIFGYCLLMLSEVGARSQALSFSFSWEFSQYAMAAVFALAAGPAIRTGVHVRITLLSEAFSGRAAKWLDIFANVTALIIVALIVSAVWTKTSTSFERNLLATTVTKIPLWMPQAFVLWGTTQLWFDLFARFLRRLTDQPL